MAMEFESLGSVPLAILSVAFLLTAACGAGGVLLSFARLWNVRTLDLVLLRIVVGLNLVALAGVVCGQVGWLVGGRQLWLLAAISLLPLTERKNWDVSSTLAWLQGAFASVDPRQWPRSLWLALMAAGITLGPALAYPAGWDELVYHGVLPRRWQADGGPAFYPDLPYSAFPSLCEILFWLMAPLECVIAPRLLIWVCWLLSLMVLARLVRRQVAGDACVMVTCACMLSPATLMISANCYVESLQMLNVAAILLAVGLKSSDNGTTERASPLLLGILAGGAAAVKLTGLTALLLPCLWYFGGARRDRSTWRVVARRMGIYSMVAVGFGLPFYWRAWSATGNPFYPYFGEWFSSDPARLEMSRFHHEIGGSFFGVRSEEAFVAGPILLAFQDRLYDGTFGWQFLVILLLAAIALVSAIRWRVGRLAVWPAIISTVLYVFWYLTAQQARFAVPILLAAVVVASFGLRRLHRPLRCWAMAVVLATTLASLPWKTAGYYFGSWETVWGFWTWADYVDDGTDRSYMPLVEAIREHTPPDAKLLLLIEHRGLYLPRANIIGTPFFQESIFTPPEEFATSDRVLEVLERNQITHLVIAKSDIGPDRAPDWWERMAPLLRSIDECERQDRLRVVWESEQHVVFAVR